MTDTEQILLVEKAKKGDTRAFEQLIKIHEHKLFPFAMSITGGDHATASDILQEALLKAYLNINQFKGDSSFISWLWRIVKNQFIDHIRSAKTRSLISLEQISEIEKASDSDTEQGIIEKERKKNLMLLMEKLPVIYNEAITLIDLKGLNYEEAADVLGISLTAVKSRVSRGRSELAKLVQKNLKLFG